MIPGFTLADGRTPELRLIRLEDSRFNIQQNILKELDQISIIDGEIKGLAAR